MTSFMKVHELSSRHQRSLPSITFHKTSDIFLSTELIPKRRLTKWIERPGFGIRKLVILKWIVLGNILTLGYKATLLSSLIPIRYEHTIDSMDDLDKSGLPPIFSKGSTIHDHMANARGEMMSRIYNRSILYSHHNGIPKWAFQMQEQLHP